MTREEVKMRVTIMRDFLAKERNLKAFDLAIQALEQEPKIGHWSLWTDDIKDYVQCSVCGYGHEGEIIYGEETPYCPMCGTKMDREVRVF